MFIHQLLNRDFGFTQGVIHLQVTWTGPQTTQVVKRFDRRDCMQQQPAAIVAWRIYQTGRGVRGVRQRSQLATEGGGPRPLDSYSEATSAPQYTAGQSTNVTHDLVMPDAQLPQRTALMHGYYSQFTRFVDTIKLIATVMSQLVNQIHSMYRLSHIAGEGKALSTYNRHSQITKMQLLVLLKLKEIKTSVISMKTTEN